MQPSLAAVPQAREEACTTIILILRGDRIVP
jgi:hypothetical protein